MNSENMLKDSSTKNFGKFQYKLRPADVMTFFFALHLILGKKLDICGRDDLFFGLHLILGKKLDICGRDDLFFGLHLILGKKLDICGRDDLFLILT